MSNFDEKMLDRIKRLEREVERLRVKESGKFIALTTPLTSTSWDGNDTKTDANRGIIDLSTVFGVPAGVKAVIMSVQGTSSTVSQYIRFGPNSTNNYALSLRVQVASVVNLVSGVVPCDANGDVYCYLGTGHSITNVAVAIWGYFL